MTNVNCLSIRVGYSSVYLAHVLLSVYQYSTRIGFPYDILFLSYASADFSSARMTGCKPLSNQDSTGIDVFLRWIEVLLSL